MIDTGMIILKQSMTGFAIITAGLPACRSAQGPSIAVTTRAGGMIFGVGDINRDAGGSAVGSSMTERAGLRHGDPDGVIDCAVNTDTETTMT